jgi:hypothetical protein
MIMTDLPAHVPRLARLRDRLIALVFLANACLNLYSRLRVEISSEKKEIEATQREIEKIETEMRSRERVSTAGDGNNATDEH